MDDLKTSIAAFYGITITGKAWGAKRAGGKGWVLAVLALSAVRWVSAAEVIRTPNYSVHISSPGFRFEVTTPAGVALPAHPVSGLSFLGSWVDGQERLSQDGGTTSWRVTNTAGQTAVVRLVAQARTIALTVTLGLDRSGPILLRTASPGPAAYGLGDLGGWQANANLATSQKTYSIRHDGHKYRWLSSFLVFPQQGAAGACFERKGGSVAIGPNEYQMANEAAAEQTFYYYVGSMEEVYAAWRDTRIAEGYPGVAPKMDGFELGFESWDLLGWKTSASTGQAAIQSFLDHGYKIRWAVTGSGFWRDDGAGGSSGTTTSFGDWNFDRYPETRTPLPPDFGDWCATKGIRWMIGQRVNFVPENGPHVAAKPSQNGATSFDTSSGTQEGLAKGYFLKDGAGGLVKVASTIFPSVACYLLDGHAPGAATWFKGLYDRWGVNGVKEDTMMSSPDHTIFNAPMLAIAESGALVMARCGAYSSPGTLTRVNDTNGPASMTLRCPINYLQYAASGAPNVYSDTVGFGSMRHVNATMRHAWLLALTAGMAVSDNPWNRGWSAADQATLKKAIDVHYQLGPYLHSGAVDSHRTGYPHTMTPLPIAFPDDTNTYDLASSSRRQFQWMIGPSLLAAPLLHDNYGKTSLLNIYLPAGTWIDIETGATYKGPITLKDFEMPIGKIPLFVGGKGIFVRRLSDAEPLKAVVYPVATAGFSYTFTYPDGASTSTIVKKSADWPQATLQVTNTTTGQAVAVGVDPETKAISFDLTPGHDYALHQQPGGR